MLDSPLAGPVCDACWISIPALRAPFCRTCGEPLPSWRVISVTLDRCARCRRAPSLIDTARAAGLYEGALREIVHAFKYDGRRGLAAPLSAMMRMAGADILSDVDAVVPVPLHPWRRVRRGFNQADDLARRLGPPVMRVLWRVGATRSQTGLTSSDRRRNVRHAFVMSPLAAGAVSGRVVALIDDVRTTGSTLEACATVLKRAGAREVRALTVALRAQHAERRSRERPERV